MEVIEKKTKKVIHYHDTPSTWFDGETIAKEVEVIDNITVKLDANEFYRLKEILALSERQYEKFLKKFR